ncbi:MAG: hypothetical protein FWG65_00165 [Turicibacter sp.]|nr:hypothetical protein [Turicibacter sp.]
MVQTATVIIYITSLFVVVVISLIVFAKTGFNSEKNLPKAPVIVLSVIMAVISLTITFAPMVAPGPVYLCSSHLRIMLTICNRYPLDMTPHLSKLRLWFAILIIVENIFLLLSIVHLLNRLSSLLFQILFSLCFYFTIFSGFFECKKILAQYLPMCYNVKISYPIFGATKRQKLECIFIHFKEKLPWHKEKSYF